jgi:hypothetical protein
MYCQISFSAKSFERLIKYRIADSFQPLTVTVPFPTNTNSWLDGMIVTEVHPNQIGNDRVIAVNELQADGTVAPNQAGISFNAAGVSIDVAADLFFVREEDVTSAGLSQPPAQTQSIPFGLIRILARVDVNASGIGQLQWQLDLALIKGLGLPPEVVAAIADATTKTVPIDISKELKDIFPAGNTKMMNAGITCDGAGSITLRFDFSGSERSANDRAADWQNFFSPTFVASLANGDCSVDLDGDAVAAALALAVNPHIKDESPLQFSGNIRSGYIGDATPRVVLTKTGLVVDACAGFPVHFALFLNLDFSIPSDNLLRGTLSLDITKSTADVARCLGNLLFDPSAVVITAAAHGQLGAGLGALASDFLFPIKGLAVLGMLSLLLAGYDTALVNGVVADRLRKQPKVTRLQEGGFAFDQILNSRNDFTKDWLVLKQCTGSGNRLLLSGLLNVPDVVLPRLTAADLEGFSSFTLVDKCDPGKGQAATGSISLSLAPGYGASLAAQPVRLPTISLKYGLQPNGNSLMYEVVNDHLRIYQDPASEYTQIYAPGIPCLVEVKLTSFTLRKAAFHDFLDHSYGLRLRFFTNGGVREYEFGAPPKLQQFVETPLQAVQRISRCKALSTSLVLKGYLEKKWLGRPPEVGTEGSQQWEVHARGLAAGRRVTVWNQDSGAELVKAFTDHRGSLNISLVLGPKESVRSILIGLDDRPFLPANRLRQISPIETPQNHVPAVRVVIRQTVLTEIDHLDFDEPIEAVHLTDHGSGSLLTVQTASGKQFVRRLSSPYVAGQATYPPVSAAHIRERAAVCDGLVAWRGNHRQFLLLSKRPGRTEVLGEYSARSLYDLAAERSDLFVQASGDGSRVVLYQKSVPVQFGTSEWEDLPYTQPSTKDGLET